MVFIPFFFFFNDTATTEIYTLSLHDALPISRFCSVDAASRPDQRAEMSLPRFPINDASAKHRLLHYVGNVARSEEHTSELQSPCNLVCRLLLEKKKKKKNDIAQHLQDDNTDN